MAKRLTRETGHAKPARRGRPPKFAEASRPITVTLPKRILDLLECVDRDRARAICKTVESALESDLSLWHTVRLVEVEPGAALIVVGPVTQLRSIPLLRLIQVAPTRFLIAIPSGTAIETVEVAILDRLADLPPKYEHERPALRQLRESIGRYRREQRLSKWEIVVVSDAPAASAARARPSGAGQRPS